MSATFWSNGSCTVVASYTAAGDFEFRGEDFGAFGTRGYEYEYVLTVPVSQFGAVRRALDVAADVDVLSAVLAAVDDIMPAGEATWLSRHGIEHTRSVWHSPPE